MFGTCVNSVCPFSAPTRPAYGLVQSHSGPRSVQMVIGLQHHSGKAHLKWWACPKKDAKAARLLNPKLASSCLPGVRHSRLVTGGDPRGAPVAPQPAPAVGPPLRVNRGLFEVGDVSNPIQSIPPRLSRERNRFHETALSRPAHQLLKPVSRVMERDRFHETS